MRRSVILIDRSRPVTYSVVKVTSMRTKSDGGRRDNLILLLLKR